LALVWGLAREASSVVKWVRWKGTNLGHLWAQDSEQALVEAMELETALAMEVGLDKKWVEERESSKG